MRLDTRYLAALALVACGRDADRPTKTTEVSVAIPEKSAKSQVPLAPSNMPSDMVPVARSSKAAAFYIDRHEVTVAEYRDCSRGGGCAAPTENPPCDGLGNNWMNKRETHPINCISIVDAWNYCRFKNKRLPSSGEFTAANLMDGGDYPWGNEAPTCDRAVLHGCGDSGTSPSGTKRNGATASGVVDLIGNVAELVGTEPGQAFNSLLLLDHVPRAGVHGGSYETSLTTAALDADAVVGLPLPSPEIGFRCASSQAGKPQIPDFP